MRGPPGTPGMNGRPGVNGTDGDPGDVVGTILDNDYIIFLYSIHQFAHRRA